MLNNNGTKNSSNTIHNIIKIIDGVGSIDGMMNKINLDMEKQQLTNKSANKSIDRLKDRYEEAKTWKRTESMRIKQKKLLMVIGLTSFGLYAVDKSKMNSGIYAVRCK